MISKLNMLLMPFAWILHLLYDLLGSYGGAIILFCLVFKIVLLPISLKGRKSMIGMSSLAEEQKKLQQKYGKDRQRYSEELQQLYARENVKPSGGCLWSMLPLPILLGLYAIVRQPLTYLMNLNSDEVNELSQYLNGEITKGGTAQLSMAQELFERFHEVQAALPDIGSKIIPVDFTFLGINLSDTPHLKFWAQENPYSWGNIGLFLLPIVAAVLGYVSMKVSNAATEKALGKEMKQDTNTKSMSIMMPVMSLWLCFTLPAGLGIYWVANNIFSILQEVLTVGTLKRFVERKKEEKKIRMEEQKKQQQEKKRQVAEQRAQTAEENKRIQMERKLSGNVISESRVGMRTYARGRTYDPNRYAATEYQDPNELLKAQTLAEEEKKNQKRRQKTNAAEDQTKTMTIRDETAVENQDSSESNPTEPEN